VAEAEEQLPPAFHINGFHDDGSIDVIWTEEDTEPSDAVEVTVVLEGIIRERTKEEGNIVEEVPTRDEVLDATTTFGIEQEVVEETLNWLIELDRVGMDTDNYVWMK
jgi:hypothetical protein